MRFMPPKPGQTAPQMPPRGPKVPINKGRPLNATGTPVGRPKAVNTGPRTPPPSANVNPIRPRGVMGTKPLNAQGVTAATPSRPKGGIGMTGGPKPLNPAIGGRPADAKMGRQNPRPSPGVPSNSIANVGTTGFKRAPATPQRMQSSMNAAMSGAGATPQRSFGAKKSKTKGRMV